MTDATWSSAKPWRRIQVPTSLIMIVVLAIVFSLTTQQFYSVSNLMNIGLQSAILLMLALPMTLIILTEGLDLSMGAMLALVSMVIAASSVAGYPVVVSLAIGLLVGAAGGLVNGVLIATFGAPPFVATLGTLGVAQSLAILVNDGQSIVGIDTQIPDLFAMSVLGIPFPILLSLLVYAFIHFLLYHTRFGVAIFALGGNRDALALSGRNTTALLIAVYTFSGVIVGLAGFLFTPRMSAGHPTASLGMEFDAIAAVALGGTSFEKGNGWLFGSILGVVAIGLLRNGLNLLGFASSIQVISVGVLVILALSLEGLRSKP